MNIFEVMKSRLKEGKTILEAQKELVKEGKVFDFQWKDFEGIAKAVVKDESLGIHITLQGKGEGKHKCVYSVLVVPKDPHSKPDALDKQERMLLRVLVEADVNQPFDTLYYSGVVYFYNQQISKQTEFIAKEAAKRIAVKIRDELLKAEEREEEGTLFIAHLN